MTGKTETFSFQAETKQLLDLMIHSLYSNKEIFLRELISNASDAFDKLRFEALTNSELVGDEDFKIHLGVDKEKRTLKIKDNAIGMNRDEVISNIGIIAKSGTGSLLKEAKEGSKEVLANLIGQFGVGFYSSFMVADKVTVLTRRAGEEKATLWESTGDGTYTLSEAEKEASGTEITLYLKDVDSENGVDDYTDFWTLSQLVKRYSDFVRYPVTAIEEREEIERDDEGKPKEGVEPKIIHEEKTLNSQKPLWTRTKSEVKDEEYAAYYKQIARDWEDPLETLPLRVEGRHEYKALLFIPKKAPQDLFQHVEDRGLRLYVRSVLIKEHSSDLLPSYLRFVQGVVDSSDLPLNISREILQKDRNILLIRKYLTKKILDTIEFMKKDDEEKYLGFWKEFGRPLKEGVTADFENKDRLLELILFSSSNDKEKLTTFKDYVERMKEGQDKIYYLTGSSRKELESSPHLEALQDKGYEILFLIDPIDELVLQSIRKYGEFDFQSVGKGEVEVGTEEEKKKEKEELEEKNKEYSDLLSLLGAKLESEVKEVRLSNRLKSSPACLVGNEFDYSPQLERLLNRDSKMPKQKRTLEVNPEHSILKDLQSAFLKDQSNERLEDYSFLIYSYALLAEGSPLTDPARFNNLVMGLIGRDLQRD